MKRLALLLLAAGLGLTALYLWRRSDSEQESEHNEAGIWRLRQLDATFNEDLLRARFSLLENYDNFERYLPEMDRLNSGLERAPASMGAASRAEIAGAAAAAAALLGERRRLFEDFKSRNAVLANSRRYFPIAVRELAGRVDDSGDSRELKAVLQDLTGVLLANLASADSFGAESFVALDRMKAWASDHPAHPEAAFVASLVRHAQQLLEGKSELDALTRQLLALPLAVEIERLARVYEDELTTAFQRTRQYRSLLYVLGGLLLAVTGYAFRSQREANRSLEARVSERTSQLQAEVEERTRTAAELAVLHRQLLETSRQAGMAEVATGVLHNVGNVLNSVNVSATLVMDQVRESKVVNLSRIGGLLRENAAGLPQFLAEDDRGRRIPGYLLTLADQVAAERTAVTDELGNLRKNIEHIRDIVTMQQAYAKVSGVQETVAVSELVEDALRMNADTLARHGLQVVRDFGPRRVVTVERHKTLQVLVNLIRNAKQACDESGRPDKRLTLRIAGGATSVRIGVTDNGVGIPAENLTRIFSHGFTTKKTGHGFGLHSGALVARELGGSLTAHSDGPGRGATFTLELPVKPEAKS